MRGQASSLKNAWKNCTLSQRGEGVEEKMVGPQFFFKWNMVGLERSKGGFGGVESSLIKVCKKLSFAIF